MLILLLLSWATRSLNSAGAHIATLGFFLCFGIPCDHDDEALATKLYLQGVTISLLFSILHNHSWIASSVVCIVGSAVFWTFQTAVGSNLSPSSLATIVLVVPTHLVVIFISNREKRLEYLRWVEQESKATHWESVTRSIPDPIVLNHPTRGLSLMNDDADRLLQHNGSQPHGNS